MDILDYIILTIFGLIFIGLIFLPYYLRHKRFIQYMNKLGMLRQPIPTLPSLQLLNTDLFPLKESFIGQYKNITITLVPLLNSYLTIITTKKTFEGTYIISKSSLIPKNNIMDWNSKAPLEYPEFNNLYKVFARISDRPFYDIDAVEMQALIQHQIDLKDNAFELNARNIYIIGGYEEPPTDNLIGMLIYNIQKAFSSNESTKINQILEQTIIINNIFNK